MIQQTDVLILGSGVAGCVAAHTLAKEGINVVMVTTGKDSQHSDSASDYEGVASCGEGDTAEQFASDLSKAGGGLACSRAVNQLVSEGPRLVKEKLVDELKIEFDKTHDEKLAFFQDTGHAAARILRCSDGTGRAVVGRLLQELRQFSNVKLLENHAAIEVVTLAKHSTKHGDLYKKPTCLGAYLLNNNTGEVTPYLAKETILATGGFGQVFLHTTNGPKARGDGLAMAHRAGARVLNLNTVQFHPLTFSMPNARSRRFPDAVRDHGGELLSHRGVPFMERHHEHGSRAPRHLVAQAGYRELVDSDADNLWLDLRCADLAGIQGKYPQLFTVCSEHGIDPTKDLIPIVPAAHCCNGGVAVDKVGQTTLQRLRAIGEVSCTGVHGEERLPGVALLESLVWGTTCARDIVKEVRKFAYYTPPVKEWTSSDVKVDTTMTHQDWRTVKQTMWNYAGLVRDRRNLRRACALLQDLKWEVEERITETSNSSDLFSLRNGVTAALLIANH